MPLEPPSLFGPARRPTGEGPATAAFPSGTRSLDDRQLMQLSHQPPRPILPLRRHAAALAPLIALVAVLAPLVAAEHYVLSETACLWGLRALHCADTPQFADKVDLASEGSDIPYPFQPPVMTWLTAISLWIFGEQRDWALILPAYLGTVGLFGACYLLLREVSDASAGFLGVLLLASQLPILELAQSPTPFALGIALCIATMACYLQHLATSRNLVSYFLLAAGMCLGISLLCVGPLALIALIVIALHALLRSRHTFSLSWEDTATDALPPALSLPGVGIIALNAFAVGGWWEWMMAANHGSAFWPCWIAWTIPFEPVALRSGLLGHAAHVLLRCESLLGGLAPLVVWSVWTAARPALPGRDVRYLSLLFLWAAGALLLWIAAPALVTSNALGESLWECFTIVPMVLLAALGCLDIIERRMSFRVATVVLSLTIGGALVHGIVLLQQPGLSSPALTARESGHVPEGSRIKGRGPKPVTRNWVDNGNIEEISPAEAKAENLAAVANDDEFAKDKILAIQFGVILVVAAAVFVMMLGINHFLNRGGIDRDKRHRRILRSLLLASWGIFAFSCTSWLVREQSHREIDQFRYALRTLPPAEHCYIVSGNIKEPKPHISPPLLTFLVRSQWPEVIFLSPRQLREGESSPGDGGCPLPDLTIVWARRPTDAGARDRGQRGTLQPLVLNAFASTPARVQHFFLQDLDVTLIADPHPKPRSAIVSDAQNRPELPPPGD